MHFAVPGFQRMSRTQTRQRPPAFNPALLIGLTLVLLTLVVYFPVVNYQFVNLDDNLYVTDNPNVQAGLTTENIAWAFTSLTAANWHPLTMLSLLTDSQLSKKDPKTGRRLPTLFHFTNLILHCCLDLRVVLGAPAHDRLPVESCLGRGPFLPPPSPCRICGLGCRKKGCA